MTGRLAFAAAGWIFLGWKAATHVRVRVSEARAELEERRRRELDELW